MRDRVELYRGRPDPSASQNSYLDGITCTSADNCLAVGYYNTSNTSGVGKPVTAQWNGHAWTLLTTPLAAAATNGGALNAVSCSAAADCTAVGSYWSKTTEDSYTLAEHWNGSSWAIQRTPSPSTVSQVEDQLNDVSCVSASSCTAVGFASGTAPTHVRPLAEYWNGSTWAVQPTATPGADEGLGGISCPSATTCTAVGAMPRDHGVHGLPVAEHK